MKNYIIIFGLLFSIFLIPSDVFAAGEDLYIPYYNIVEDFDIKNGEGLDIKNTLYSDSNVEQREGDKCILFYQPNSSNRYVLSCILSDTRINFGYNSSNSNFLYIFSSSGFNIYYFDENYNFVKSNADFIYRTSKNSFENFVLYSDIPVKFTANGVDTFYFYDINNSSNIYGQFNTTDTYSYTDLYLTEFDKDIIIFDDNDFHTISKLVLGDNIPEEFSFVYTISDYLLCILLVIVISSPIAIIIKVLRW